MTTTMTLIEGTADGGEPRETWALPWDKMDKVSRPTTSKLRMPVYARELAYIHPAFHPGKEGGSLHCFGGADVPPEVLLSGDLDVIRAAMMEPGRKTTARVGMSCRSLWWWHTAHQGDSMHTADASWYPDNDPMELAERVGMEFVRWPQGLYIHYRRGGSAYSIGDDGKGTLRDTFHGPQLIRKRPDGSPMLDHTELGPDARPGDHMAYFGEVPKEGRDKWFLTYAGTMIYTYRGFDPNGPPIIMSYGPYPHMDEINAWEDGGEAWDFALTHNVGDGKLRAFWPLTKDLKPYRHDAINPGLPPMFGGAPIPAMKIDPGTPATWKHVDVPELATDGAEPVDPPSEPEMVTITRERLAELEKAQMALGVLRAGINRALGDAAATEE